VNGGGTLPGPGAPEPGELAIVLHTHMPYVEGYDRWPFGEEWLWEAIATSYLRLLDVLAAGAVTLSLTPVLCDQLEAPGLPERFLDFLRGVRAETHGRDIAAARAEGDEPRARELERSLGDYGRAAERFELIGRDLVGALAPHAAWTSAATHAVLPLLATDAGVRLQVQTGVDAHRRRFGAWRGGFWLPECAHAPCLDPLLEEAGVHAACADLTDVLGLGAPAHLRPLRTEAGPLLVPIDRQTIDLVWSPGGYPRHGRYRDSHRLTEHHHRPWANDGRVYDPGAARAVAREHAADFVDRVLARLGGARAALGRPGLCVFAVDTELLGHWWYEGPAWLAAVLDEAGRRGLALTALDDALARHEPADPPAEPLPVTTWGEPRNLSTWDGPPVAELAWRSREAELRLVAAGNGAGAVAARELLALQSSDWAFLISRDLAADYGRRRAALHAEALDAALAGAPGPGPRGLATRCAPELLGVP
jgi:1,4-alpha-glucan branching enzyme